MPTALFIPEEHNCCYRYSYSGALQTPAASVSANNTAQYTHACAHTDIHTQTHACHTHFHGYSELLWPSTFTAFPVHFPVRSRGHWREYLPHRAACQRAPRTPNWHQDGTRPRPPAPNDYAHNHLKAKEDGEQICMVLVAGARSLDCKRRLAPYSLDVYVEALIWVSLWTMRIWIMK